MTDPVTTVDQDDPLPVDEEAEEVESGAFMGDRPAEPTEDPDPEGWA